jgi:anaphase-promoting complex subunit 10
MAESVGLHYRPESSNSSKNESEKHEIGDWAVWSLSSAKSGFGVQQLRDDDFSTYWQSDGDQPHYINIQFHKKMTIQEVALQLWYIYKLC